MLKKLKIETINLIKEYRKNLKVNDLILEADIEKIFNYFEMLENSISLDKSEGKQIDEDFFKQVCDAVDDLLLTEDDSIDLIDLNKKIKM